MWDKNSKTIMFIVYTEGAPDSMHLSGPIFIFALGLDFQYLAQQDQPEPTLALSHIGYGQHDSGRLINMH